MTRLPLFDGEARKARGLAQVEKNEPPTTIELLRQFARNRCHKFGTVNMDQVRQWATLKGLKVHHPNVWGVVFKGKEWEPTGERVKSRRASNHAREIRVWRLRK